MYLVFPSGGKSRYSSLGLPPCYFFSVFCFRGWCCCRPCAVVAVVRSSSMVVLCLSEQLLRRMSSANLIFERFVSGSYSTLLTPWLPLFPPVGEWFHDVP